MNLFTTFLIYWDARVFCHIDILCIAVLPFISNKSARLCIFLPKSIIYLFLRCPQNIVNFSGSLQLCDGGQVSDSDLQQWCKSSTVELHLVQRERWQLEQLQTGPKSTFNRTDPTHRGWYHCTAQNQHGSQNSSVMLDIQCEYYHNPFYFLRFISTLKSNIKWIISVLNADCRFSSSEKFIWPSGQSLIFCESTQ